MQKTKLGKGPVIRGRATIETTRAANWKEASMVWLPDMTCKFAV